MYMQHSYLYDKYFKIIILNLSFIIDDTNYNQFIKQSESSTTKIIRWYSFEFDNLYTYASNLDN